MGVLLSVQVLKGGQPIGQYQFDSDTNRTVKMGRLASAHIKLEDPKVSRIHAVIEFAGEDVSVIDMGSTEGTTVNGTKVHRTKINHGDQITIGDLTLLVGIGQPAGFGAGPPAAVPAGMPGAAPAGMPGAAPAGMPGYGAPAGMPQQAEQPVGGQQPRFDPGAGAQPIKRITRDHLRAAAVESRPHPSLPPEEAVTNDNRILEMRIYWGESLLDIHHYYRPKRITIGENKRTNYFISSEGLPVEEFPLVRYLNDEYVVTFTNEMEGEIEVDRGTQPLQEIRGSSMARRDDSLELSYQVPMPISSRAVVHWGGATFALRFVSPPRAIPNSFFKNMDLNYLNTLLASIFLHIAMLVTLIVYPTDTAALRESLFDEDKRGRFEDLVLNAPQESESTKNMLEKLKKTVEENKEERKKEEPKPEQRKELKISKVVPKNVKPRKSQEQKRAELKQKFSKLLTGSSGGGSLLGGGGGGTLAGTLSNVIGTAGRGSATAGLAGLGIRGGGPMTGGGVGTSLGVGGIGTSGRLGGGGLGYGGGVGLGKRKSRNMISLSTPVIMGALPKEVIQKVINENKNQIRYCYETELQRNQNLEGRVMMNWIIAATGLVAKVTVKESSIKNANVERCIARKIKGWKFPAPAGGGIVTVNYPFVLKAS